MASKVLLDTFCGAGGAGYGYHLAGFEVIGVDINPQPEYPFKFIQSDAIEFIDKYGHEFDVIHASPPCQRYSFATLAHRNLGKEYVDLVDSTRKVLLKSGRFYVIENVDRAPLVDPIMLCGTMFGLRVIRHRLFESNVNLVAPVHQKHVGTVADGTYVRPVGHGGGRKHGTSNINLWREAMGIDWIHNRKSLAEAIPPAYTEFIGKQLISLL